MGVREVHGRWHFRFKLGGKEYTGNTGLSAAPANRAKAELIAATQRELVKRGLDITPPSSMLFPAAAERFLTWADAEYREHPNTALRLRTSFVSLTAFFRKRPVGSVIADDLEHYMAWRKWEHDVRELTLRNDLHALSAFFRYAIRCRWASRNPVSGFKIPSGSDAAPRRALTADEERRYFEECRELGYFDLFDVGRLVLLQGARSEEVLRLEQADIDLGRMVAIIRGDSGRPARELRLTPEALAILARRLRTPGRWVFPNPKNPSRHLARVTAQHVKVLKALDCRSEERFWLLDLRHTFAERCAGRGMPLPELAAALGISLSSAARYFHVANLARPPGRSWGKGGRGC